MDADELKNWQEIQAILQCGASVPKTDHSAMRALLQRLGEPQSAFPAVIVAGTNGKGSTCAALDAVLRAAGYRVGLYTSPYLQHFSERFRLNGACARAQDLLPIVLKVDAACKDLQQLEITVNPFERMTAACMLLFAGARVDIAVMEVGLGGRLDPVACGRGDVKVLTPVSLDHTRILGGTLGEIARNKLGILNPGDTLVVGPQQEPVMREVRGAVKQKACYALYVDDAEIGRVSDDANGHCFDLRYQSMDLKRLRFPLPGAMQRYNAVSAMLAAFALRKKGWSIGNGALRKGLAGTCWPGRMERIFYSGVDIWLDCAHNPDAAEHLVRDLKRWRRTPFVLLTACKRDKDIAAMAKVFSGAAVHAVCVCAQPDTGMDPRELALCYRNAGVPSAAAGSLKSALDQAFSLAKAHNLPLVAAGSIPLAGWVRGVLKPYSSEPSADIDPAFHTPAGNNS